MLKKHCQQNKKGLERFFVLFVFVFFVFFCFVLVWCVLFLFCFWFVFGLFLVCFFLVCFGFFCLFVCLLACYCICMDGHGQSFFSGLAKRILDHFSFFCLDESLENTNMFPCFPMRDCPFKENHHFQGQL